MDGLHESVHLEMGEDIQDYSDDDIPECAHASDDFLMRPPVRGKFVKAQDRTAYAVYSHHGFERSELLSILSGLCKAQIALSIIFMVHGSVCPGPNDKAAYQGLCHMNIVAALVGILTGGIGIGALNRYRWKGMTMIWLILVIISAVAYLLVVIHAAVWIDAFSKLEERTGLSNGLSGCLLLLAVALGVTFIITGIFVCHHWNSYATKYHVMGRFARRNPVAHYRRSTNFDSPNESMGDIPMTNMQYHMCTNNCNH